MNFRFACKGASFWVAPFALWVLLLGTAPGLSAAACTTPQTDERVTVVHVYDGDTVKLADGRRLRLIGINAPEMRPDQPAAEPFAAEAKARLQKLLDNHNRRLLLRYGKEHQDHYGRLLAHAFLENGDNIAARLLAAGLATRLAVPPNTWAQDCYGRQEDRARAEQRGIWGHPRYRSIDSRDLPASAQGYRLVYGTVQQVEEAGGTRWIGLPGGFSVRIARRDQVNFPTGYLERLVGKTVEVRGWIRSRPQGLVMTVRHPSSLSVFSSR